MLVGSALPLVYRLDYLHQLLSLGIAYAHLLQYCRGGISIHLLKVLLTRGYDESCHVYRSWTYHKLVGVAVRTVLLSWEHQGYILIILLPSHDVHHWLFGCLTARIMQLTTSRCYLLHGTIQATEHLALHLAVTRTDSEHRHHIFCQQTHALAVSILCYRLCCAHQSLPVRLYRHHA